MFLDNKNTHVFYGNSSSNPCVLYFREIYKIFLKRFASEAFLFF